MVKSVLFFTPSLKFGGAENALVTLANCLNKTGFKVHYCCGEGGELESEISKNITRTIFNKLRLLTALLPLYKTILKYKPDVVITTLSHCNIALVLISLLYNLLNRKKIEVIIRETTNISLRLEQMPSHNRFLYKTLMKLCYPKAKKVIFPNNSLKVKFESYFKVKLTNSAVIYNASSFNSNEHSEDGETSFVHAKELTLLSVGRLVKTKRIEDLINVIPKLETPVKLNVDIVGEGPEKERLISLTKQNGLHEVVNFKGYIKAPFSQYDPKKTIFILTSELEGMPNSLIESISLGFVAISANCEYGPIEIFDKFKINKKWLYSPSDVEGLSKCLQRLLTDDEKYLVSFSGGYEAFSKEQYINKYMQVIG